MTSKGSIKIDIFECTVHVIVSTNIKKSINWYLRHYDDDPIDFDVYGFCYRDTVESLKNYYLFFNQKDLSVNIVNHEKSHVVEHILKDRDIRPVDEIRAYLDGYIARKMNEFFKRKGIKVKDK